MDLTKAKPIEISDKAVFDKYFKNRTSKISEFTFTNLFIWRNYYNYLYLEWNDHLLIFSRKFFKKTKTPISGNGDTLFFLPPIGPNPLDVIFDIFESNKLVEIHRIPHLLAKGLQDHKRNQPIKLKCVDDQNNWDYVYEKEKLISLTGRKLYRKRRWLKRFLENYPDYKFQLFSEEWLETCKQLQIKWCDLNECRASDDLVEEQKVITDAFDYYSDLKYRGGLVLVNGKCIAYTLGELLNAETVVIHIEKALIDWEGSYQAINNFFAKYCCDEVNYINREQDLGDPGLRQAKQSYIPHHMVKKSIIYRSNR